jgi:hypothetical protein
MDQLYKNIVSISKYKIYIADKIKLYINNISHLKSIDIYEIYRCHKILFKTNNLIPQLNMNVIDNINQPFTIHHFIYYIIKEISNIYKRNSIYQSDFDIIDLLQLNLKKAYELHLDSLIDKIYDYLYPNANLKILSLVFIIFKNIIKRINVHDLIYISLIRKFDFTKWTEYDLLYNLEFCINELKDENMHNVFNSYIIFLDTSHYNNELNGVNFSIIHLIYYSILQNIEEDKYTMNDLISVINYYKQVRCHTRLRIYEEELIMKTWHPDRLMDWCLDIDEKNDFEVNE